MRRFVCLAFGFAACAFADEAADRAAISRLIAALNVVPTPATLFTADSDAPAVLRQLRKAPRVQYRLSPGPVAASGTPTVTISHEPWGEATINFPGVVLPTSAEVVNPKITAGEIRFLTPEVAIVEGACTYQADADTTQTTPLLFVVKREKDDWQIALLRVLAR